MLGDDSITGMIIPECDPENLDPILKRMEQIARDELHVILNLKKSKITRAWDLIEVLGYRNLFGYPVRDTERMIAVFLMPERRVNAGRIKARALGLAYANCGMD